MPSSAFPSTVPISRLRRVGAAAVAATLLAAALPAQAQSKRAVFDLSIAGFRAGTMALSTAQSGDDYAAATSIKAAGLLGVLTDFGFDGQASGRIADEGRLVPRRFTADSQSPRAARHTEIDWEDGLPVRVSVEPPRSTAPDPARQGGTLDPVSAGFAVLRDTTVDALCDTTVDVFDGSRRSRLRLSEPVATEGGYFCAGAYSRIEGEAHSMSDQKEYPFRLFFSPNGEGLVQLERLETDTRFGRAVLTRRG